MDSIRPWIYPFREPHCEREDDFVKVPEEIEEVGVQLEDFRTHKCVYGVFRHLAFTEIHDAEGGPLTNGIFVESLGDLTLVMLDKGIEILCVSQVLDVDVFVSEEVPLIYKSAFCSR